MNRRGLIVSYDETTEIGLIAPDDGTEWLQFSAACLADNEIVVGATAARLIDVRCAYSVRRCRSGDVEVLKIETRRSQ